MSMCSLRTQLSTKASLEASDAAAYLVRVRLGLRLRLRLRLGLRLRLSVRVRVSLRRGGVRCAVAHKG